MIVCKTIFFFFDIIFSPLSLVSVFKLSPPSSPIMNIIPPPDISLRCFDTPSLLWSPSFFISFQLSFSLLSYLHIYNYPLFSKIVQTTHFLWYFCYFDFTSNYFISCSIQTCHPHTSFENYHFCFSHALILYSPNLCFINHGWSHNWLVNLTFHF